MDDEPTRRKVTLAWNGEDVAAAMRTLFEKGDAAKYIDLPLSNYSTWPNDKVLLDGEHGRRLDLLRLQLQRALDALAGGRRRRTSRSAPRSRSSGARRTAARRSRSSSATAGRDPRDRQPRARTRRSPGRRTPRAPGGRRPRSRRPVSTGSDPSGSDPTTVDRTRGRRRARRSSSSARACCPR